LAPGQAGSFLCVARINRSHSGSFITESCAFFGGQRAFGASAQR
jgi:hypothetical protein